MTLNQPPYNQAQRNDLDRKWRVKNAPKLSSKYLAHEIGAKLVSNWEQNMLHNKN